MKKTGEDILRDAILEANGEEYPDQISDPTMWISLIVALLEAFRNCRNQNTVKSHLKRGSALVEIKIRRALRKEGFKGRDKRRKMARILTKKGTKLTPEEVEAILDDANDVPDPPPVDGGLWPVWVLAMFLVFGLQSSLLAGDLWPTAEANLWPTADSNANFSVVDEIARTAPVLWPAETVSEVPAPVPVAEPACAQPASDCSYSQSACVQESSDCSYAGASDCGYSSGSGCSGRSRREARRERRRARRSARKSGGCG